MPGVNHGIESNSRYITQQPNRKINTVDDSKREDSPQLEKDTNDREPAMSLSPEPREPESQNSRTKK